jgi:hypothetical protein
MANALFETVLSLSNCRTFLDMFPILSNPAASLPATSASFFFLRDKELVGVAQNTNRFAWESSPLSPLIISQRHVLVNTESDLGRLSGIETASFLVVPVVRGGRTAAVLILHNKQSGFSESDVSQLAAFASLASLGLQLDATAYSVSQFVTDDEKRQFATPAALRLTPEEAGKVNSMACFSLDFRGIGHVKECFFFFDDLNLARVYPTLTANLEAAKANLETSKQLAESQS